MSALAKAPRMRTARPRRLAAVAIGVGVLLILAVLLLGVDLLAGLHRLPDRAQVVDTRWASTQWVRERGKAYVTLRVKRGDGRPITSRFDVFAYGGRVNHSGPSDDTFRVLPVPAPAPAAPTDARVVIKLEMIPSRPSEGCDGEVIFYNDAPAWQLRWTRILPDFLHIKVPIRDTRTWKVNLPPYPGSAAVAPGE